MKIEKINLQRFADEGEDSSSESTQEKDTVQKENDKSTENKKSTAKEDSSKKESDEKKYSDKDLDRIINKKFAKWKQEQDKAVDEAKKLAEMSAQEKAEYERDKFKEELEALKNERTLNEMSKTARKMLSDEGINISDELLANLVSADAEKTKTAITDFTKLFKDEVDKAVKEALKGNSPKKGSSKKEPITKEQIMAIENPLERQKLIAENMKLFE